jgi:heme/copper-type cytochrome/quinol oxidase subunit 3
VSTDISVISPPHAGEGGVIDHGEHGGEHGEPETSTGLNSRKLLMWTFLGSDCVFFACLIATFMVNVHKSVSGPTPEEVLDIPYTSVSAFVLLMSSLTMVLALAAIQRNDLYRYRIWMVTTALLGLVFLGGQAYEFNTFYYEHLWLQTNMYGSAFLTLTGFHGTHVFIGVIWLFSMVWASFTGRIRGAQDALSVEITGLYWHFVDVVWIVIFTLVYLVQAEPPH